VERTKKITVSAALAATTLALLGGLLLKDRCTTHQWDGYQYRTSCYNDVFALYFFRGLQDRVFPYIHGDGVMDTGGDGDLEYPVVTGYFVGAIAQVVHGGQEFFRANAAGLAAAGLAAAGLLAALARDRRRVFFFALAPAVVLYAFHNWDLLAVAAMVGGLYAFRARADRTAGALLGLGAAAKLFPGLILPALALARWRQRGRPPVGMIAWAAGIFAAANLPVLLWNPTGWAFAWKFQSTRFPNFETSWYFLYRHLSGLFGGSFWSDTYPRATSVLSGLLFAAGALLLLRAEAKREHQRPYAAAFGLLVIFLLTAKVYSPQYSLWILPFFVLLRMPWYAFAAFAVTDAAVWFAISAYFLAAPPLSAGDPALRLTLTEAAVWVRYAVLAWLLWLSRRAEENVEDLPPQSNAVWPAREAY